MAESYYIGLMSGTSLDGVDAALVKFSNDKIDCTETFYEPYDSSLRATLIALHTEQANELELSLVTANQISDIYAKAVRQLLTKANVNAKSILAIGAHGQTIRHRPELGFTCQLLNAPLLAEKAGINVIHDFRSADIAAGGQGAPLIPAFHQAAFSSRTKNRAVINIGGISNVSYLSTDKKIIGFDTGPGNLLLDHWTQLKLNKPYDHNGAWAKSGKIIDPILASMLSDKFFQLPPPKSTGRDLFNADWLQKHILYPHTKPEDIARTLVEFTAQTIKNEIDRHCGAVDEAFICGGGAHNTYLIDRISSLCEYDVFTTEKLGIHHDWVEAIGFAWLAKQYVIQQPGNIPSVTGASGPRILGTMSVTSL